MVLVVVSLGEGLEGRRHVGIVKMELVRGHLSLYLDKLLRLRVLSLLSG